MDATNPTNIDELLSDAYAQAPSHIKTYLESGKFDAFLASLRVNKALHVDTLARVSDEILMMLLGMSEPSELPDNLKKEARLSDEQVAIVIQQANEQIFVPLQEEMRTLSSSIQTTAVLRSQASSASSAPMVSVPSLKTTQPKATPAPTIITPPQAPAVPEQPAWAPPPAPIEPTMRTMAHDVEAMKTGTIPAPTPYTMPVAPATPPPPEPHAPAKIEIAPPLPRISPNPSLSAPVAPSRTFTPTHTEVVSTLQKYGIDPYREPAE